MSGVLLTIAEQTISSFKENRVPLRLSVKKFRENLVLSGHCAEHEADNLVNTVIHHVPLVICTLAMRDLIISTTHLYLVKYLATECKTKNFIVFLFDFLKTIAGRLESPQIGKIKHKPYIEIIRTKNNNVSKTISVSFPNLPTFLAIKYFLRSYWVNNFENIPAEWANITLLSDSEQKWLDFAAQYKDINILYSVYFSKQQIEKLGQVRAENKFTQEGIVLVNQEQEFKFQYYF